MQMPFFNIGIHVLGGVRRRRQRRRRQRRRKQYLVIDRNVSETTETHTKKIRKKTKQKNERRSVNETIEIAQNQIHLISVCFVSERRNSI